MRAYAAIDRVINSPKKKYSDIEAKQLLRKYGVFTKDNTVSKTYRDIIVAKKGAASEPK